MEATVGDMLAEVHHACSHFKITLALYLCEITTGKPEARCHQRLKWLLPAQLTDHAFPAATLRLFPAIGVE